MIRTITACSLMFTSMSCETNNNSQYLTQPEFPAVGTIPYIVNDTVAVVPHDAHSVAEQLRGSISETLSSQTPVEILIDGGDKKFQGIRCVSRIQVSASDRSVSITPLVAGDQEAVLDDMRISMDDTTHLDTDLGRSTHVEIPISRVNSPATVTTLTRSLLRTSLDGCHQWVRDIAPRQIGRD